jgi:hypothetical protein
MKNAPGTGVPLTSGLGQHQHHADQEDDREHREGDPLEDLHEVVAEHGDAERDRQGQAQAEVRAPPGERGERECAADAVHGEPDQPAEERVEAGGEEVAVANSRFGDVQTHARW